MARITGSNIRSALFETTAEVASQPPPETQVTQPPKAEPLVQARSFEYASSMMGERRMSSQETKDKFDEASEQYLFYKPDKFDLLKNLTTSDAFAKLEPDASQMYRALNKVVSGDQNRFDNYQNILNNVTDLDKGVQARVLNAAERNGLLDSGIQSLNTLVSSDLFKNAPPEVQQSMIDTYFVLFPGSDIEIV